MFPNPVFISLYILVFAFLWVIVCGLISLIGGWYAFVKHNPYPENLSQEIDHFPFSSLQINNFGSYNNSVVVRIYKEGISITPQLLFRAFHKPLFIKWNQISKIEPGKEFIWFNKTDVYANGNRFRFYRKAAESINQNFSLNRQF